MSSQFDCRATTPQQQAGGYRVRRGDLMTSTLRTIALFLASGGSVVACDLAGSGGMVGGEEAGPTQPKPRVSAQALDSVSPAVAIAGSSDLTVTLTGSGFKSGRFRGSRAAWRTSAGGTYLNTTFVDSTRLTAVIPAGLLKAVVAAQVYVATGDIQGDIPLAESNAVAFTVTAAPAVRHTSTLPTVFDVGTLTPGQSVHFSRTLLSTDPICLYWWDYRGFDVAEACHGYRVTIAAAGHLRAILTWSPDGWMSLANEDQGGLPTADGPPMRFSRAVEAGQTFVVTVGNHGGNPRVDYTLQLQLVP